MCIFHSFVSIKIYNTLLYFYYEMYCYQFSTIPLFQKFDHMTTNLKLLWRNHRFWRNIFSNYIHILKKVVYKLTDKLFFFCIEQEYFKTKLEKCEGLGLVCVGTICFMYLLLLPIALTFTKWTITGIAKTKISLCNWLRRKIFWLELPTQCQTPSHGAYWYTACGVPLPNRVEMVAIVSLICLVATTVFTNSHFGSYGDGVFGKQLAKVEKDKTKLKKKWNVWFYF